MNISRHPDAIVAAWLDDGPDALPDDTRQAIAVGIRTLRRRRPRINWPFGLARLRLPSAGLRPISLALVAIALLAVATVVVSSLRLGLTLHGPATVPTTPDVWERILIETPSGTGSVVSLAATPAGLLAVLGEEMAEYPEETRLAVSADGRNWTLVPAGQHPSLSSPRSFGYPSVVGTDHAFILLDHHEVWISANGYDWRRLASPGRMRAATSGDPGLVAVGDDRAWYSVDGSDWSVAAVPALPAEILARPDSERYADMRGVTAAGDDLVAWGIAEVPLADNSGETLVVPLLWASSDGRSWISVVDPEMDSVTAVTGGPGGFVAAGQAGYEAAVWISADGESWERVADGAFTSHRSADSGGTLALESAASTTNGYVVVGGDGLCLFDPCPDEDAVIWTSADGRSWSRVPSDDLFGGARANKAVAWGSHFVVGGVQDGKPVIWISGSEASGSGANASIAPALTIPAPTPSQPVDFTGTWEATDPPPDNSHLTMEVVALRDGAYGVTIRDDFASVCDGASSTMTGVAEATEPGTIAIQEPDFVCDDGSEAHALSGPPLDQQLRNLSFSYDPLRDALFDSLGLEWTR